MPNKDKTGPQGKGPLSGRGQGECLDHPENKCNRRSRHQGRRRRCCQNKA